MNKLYVIILIGLIASVYDYKMKKTTKTTIRKTNGSAEPNKVSFNKCFNNYEACDKALDEIANTYKEYILTEGCDNLYGKYCVQGEYTKPKFTEYGTKTTKTVTTTTRTVPAKTVTTTVAHPVTTTVVHPVVTPVVAPVVHPVPVFHPVPVVHPGPVYRPMGPRGFW